MPDLTPEQIAQADDMMLRGNMGIARMIAEHEQLWVLAEGRREALAARDARIAELEAEVKSLREVRGRDEWRLSLIEKDDVIERLRARIAELEAIKDRHYIAVEYWQRDLAEILGIIGLGTHARPISPHECIQQEVLPRLREMAAAITWRPDA